MNTNLIINLYGIAIRQDTEGRFCLNDLHKAAGNNPSQRPTNWLRTQQTQDLINELSSNMSLDGQISDELTGNSRLAQSKPDELSRNSAPGKSAGQKKQRDGESPIL